MPIAKSGAMTGAMTCAIALPARLIAGRETDVVPQGFGA